MRPCAVCASPATSDVFCPLCADNFEVSSEGRRSVIFFKENKPAQAARAKMDFIDRSHKERAASREAQARQQALKDAMSAATPKPASSNGVKPN